MTLDKDILDKLEKIDFKLKCIENKMKKFDEKFETIQNNQKDIIQSQKRQEIHNTFITRLYFIFRNPLFVLGKLLNKYKEDVPPLIEI